VLDQFGDVGPEHFELILSVVGPGRRKAAVAAQLEL